MKSERIVQLIHTQRMNRIWARIADGLCRYFRVEVRGEHRIPQESGAVVIPNHSGFSGTDAVVLSHLLHQKTGRNPKILAHPFYFKWLNTLNLVSRSFGLVPTESDEAISYLKKKELLVIFPEAESGNFKSTLKRYHLQRFHTGFIRMALVAGVPVIPCYIVGAEEAHLSLGKVGLGKLFGNFPLQIPLPLNPIPLPSKWWIEFGEPLALEVSQEQLENAAALEREAERIRHLMQNELMRKIKSRPYIYTRFV